MAKDCGHHPDLLCGCGVFPKQDRSEETVQFLREIARGTGTCMHGEVECTPTRHATCRHCGKKIIIIQSWGTQQWLHKGTPNGGSSYLPCPTTQAEPHEVVGREAHE